MAQNPRRSSQTNANNMEIWFYIQSVCSRYMTTLNVKKCASRGKSAVSERQMEKVQSLGSVLTNSILCFCSCFHGALSVFLCLSVPSLSLSRSLSLSLPLSHAHASVWKRIQLCESICNQPQLMEREREREPLVLVDRLFSSALSLQHHAHLIIFFFNLITIIS